MTKSSTMAAALALTLFLPITAGAATVSTAALEVQFLDRAACTLVNVGQRPVRVRSLELIGFLGETFASLEGIELAPRRTLQVFVRGREHGVANDPMFCQAGVDGSARQVRLTICTGAEFGRCEAVTD